MPGKLLIVEDEPIIRQDIKFVLEDNGYTVVEAVGDFEKARSLLKSSAVDLVLLDINIEGEKDGIDLAKIINQENKIPFIYLTSYYDTETVMRAKATFPSAYIIKPFDEKDLLLNIELALFKSKKKANPFESNKLFVKKNNDLIAIKAEEIVYVEGEDNYSNIYTENEKYLVSHTLKKIEEKLNSKGIIRVHKSFLVNFEKIDSISEGMVFLGTHHLPIGKSYRSQLQQLLVTL